MSNLIGLTINASSTDKFKIYPYNSNNKIAYSLKINDSSNAMKPLKINSLPTCAPT